MKKVFLFLASGLLAMQLSAQNIQQKMDELLGAFAANGQFNGSVLVAQKGKVLIQKGYGFRNAEEKLPNDENSIFQIGSVTKQFTAAIIMQLRQEGKLSLQDKLQKYFPGFVNGDKITIEHLLTHTSGLYNYTNDTAIMKRDVTKHYSRDEMMEVFKKYPSDFEPGTKWNYSNTAYSVLGYIIEKVTGRPYEAEVRQRILQPLGMTHSGFDFTHLKDGNRTRGYYPGAKPAPVVDSTIAYSAGAMYSTVGDLLKWERAIYTDRILKPESWKASFTPYKNKYGYGWTIDTAYGRSFTAHSGGIPGYSSYLLRFPEEELVVIIADNTSSKSLSKISRSLAAIVVGAPYTVPEVKKAMSVELSKLQQYVGEYELAPGFIIAITLEGQQLKGQATGQPAFDLFPEKENLFYLKVVDAKVEFVKDGSGKVSELILYQNGQQPRGKKIR